MRARYPHLPDVNFHGVIITIFREIFHPFLKLQPFTNSNTRGVEECQNMKSAKTT